MEKLMVAGQHGKLTSCIDARKIQPLNQQAVVLFGKDHIFEPNFFAPMALPNKYENPIEEELLGIEYAYCQSSDFKSKDYYIQKLNEEQTREEENEDEDEDQDEGVETEVDVEDTDPIDDFNVNHTVITEQVNIESPVLQDVLLSKSHLHLPGFQEVEDLALLLLDLSDDTDRQIVPLALREKIKLAASKLHDHDKSVRSFVKKYESKWGYTLFGRCLGPESQESSAAQKTKFGWMRYAQACQITEESRLIYIMVKMLRNRKNVGSLSSPSKQAAIIKSQYKRIVDRVRDDPILSELAIPLPNINAKSITTFISRQDKRANLLATRVPQVPTHKRVFSETLIPEASELPSSLPQPSYSEVQYSSIPHESGKRRGEKSRFQINIPETSQQDDLSQKPSTSTSTLPHLSPKPTSSSAMQPNSSGCGMPILLVVPSQPTAQSVVLQPSTSSVPFIFQSPPPPQKKQTYKPNPSNKPCAACQIPNCAGRRQRYRPSMVKIAESKQKIFTFCPTTRKSTTPGFEGTVYDDYDHFKLVVDEELERRKDK